MDIATKLFGRIEYTEENVIIFAEGLIGIPEYKRFLLIENPDFKPFSYLQCLDNPNMAMVVISPLHVENNYQFIIDDTDLKAVDAKDSSDFQLLAVVIFSPQPENVRVNLKAPLLINVRNKKAKQVFLLNDDYGVAEPLLKPSTFITHTSAESEKT